MAAPYRRSSRISGLPTTSQKIVTPNSNKLSSLLERDESPESAHPNIDALVSSPVPPNTAPNLARFDTVNSALKTPQTASRILPSKSEMHPSKIHLSTKKLPALQGSLGSHPVNALPRSPSKIAIYGMSYVTPTKTDVSLSRNMMSPSFDFSFERPESDLSAEAQKIMESVREEAAKIKAQMTVERGKQVYKDGEAEKLYGGVGRQIRKPKGKSGRFSEVHKQEFRKMDSIANHASNWKHKLQGAASSPLKRSPSKAGLDGTPKSLLRTKSFEKLHEGSIEPLEDSSPSKRAKLAHDEDTSSTRLLSRSTVSRFESTPTTPAKTHPIGGLPSAATTPTKASLARSASVKSLKTSMMPSSSMSTSAKLIASPTAPKTEGSKKHIGSWSRFGGSMKSILHLSQPKYSNDPSKVAAGTHLPPPQSVPDNGKDQPSLPNTPTTKRVNFTSSTKSRAEQANASNPSSCSKIPTLCTTQARGQAPNSPTIATSAEDSVTYPDLGTLPNRITRNRSPKPCATPPSRPRTLAFSTDKTIDFQATGFASPNSTTTIRQVRPSGIPTSMPGGLDEDMPAIPHGMSNKKRKHLCSDEDEEVENIDPQTVRVDVKGYEEGDGRPSTKKQRVVGPSSPIKGVQGQLSSSKRRMTGTGAVGSRVPKKGGLSLSRLNMLARPKERR